MKKFFQNACLVTLAVVSTLLMVEGLAWFAPDAVLPARLRELRDQLERDRNARSFISPDRELIFKIKPNQDFLVKHPDYQMRIVTRLNLPDIGFRGGSLGGEPWAIAVGDSFTFGQGVDHEAVWTTLLAQAAGKEVINMGVPSQGPAQYTRILKRYGLPLNPRVVFYGFYFNDLDSAARFRRNKRGIPIRRHLRDYSVVYNLMGGIKRTTDEAPVLFKTKGVELVLGAEGLRRNLERQAEKFDERWAAVRQEIDEAIAVSQAAGVKFVLFYFPSRWEVYWELIKTELNFPSHLDIDRLHRQVIEYCGSKKILCLDLTPALKREASRNQQLYFPIDGHWNVAGNRIVAEAMREFVVSHDL